MLDYPRWLMSAQLGKGEPVVAIYSDSKNEQIMFFLWLQNFKKCVKLSNNDPVFVLNNHASHISLRIRNYCGDNEITTISIPPHLLLHL